MIEFVFNIPLTAKVICHMERGSQLKRVLSNRVQYGVI